MWLVVTILDSEGLEDSGYFRSANECPTVVGTVAGDQNSPCWQATLSWVQMATRAMLPLQLGGPRPDPLGEMSGLQGMVQLSPVLSLPQSSMLFRSWRRPQWAAWASTGKCSLIWNWPSSTTPTSWPPGVCTTSAPTTTAFVPSSARKSNRNLQTTRNTLSGTAGPLCGTWRKKTTTSAWKGNERRKTLH